MPSASGFIKGVCAFLCIPIIALIIVSILTYWRNIYATPLKSVDYLNVGKDQFFGLRSRTDKPVAFAGIIDNCFKNDVLFIGRLCDLPDGTGFVGETAIVWLLCIAAIIYAINFFIILGSICLPKIAYILPIICFIPTALIASAAIVFGVYYNDIYKNDQNIVYERDEYGQNVVVAVNDDYTNVTLPNKITFAIGFYLAIIAMVFSFFTMLLSIGAAMIKPKEEKPVGNPQPQQQPPSAAGYQQPQQQYQYYPQQQQQQGYPVQGYYPQQQPAAQPYPYQYRPPQAYPTQTPPAYQQPPPQQQGQQTPQYQYNPQQHGYITPQTPQQYVQPQQQQVYTPPYSPAPS
uniref:Uncharacterized protein n=1 Tax=Panagrolaimus davidi TaxID=227884 RepID=A0A914Q5M4_9BILA